MKNCAKLITTIIVLIFITFLIILSANLLCIKPNNEYTNYYEQIGINNIILSKEHKGTVLLCWNNRTIEPSLCVLPSHQAEFFH